MNPTTPVTALDSLVDQMTRQVATLTHTLGQWMQESPRTLEEAEQAILPQMRAVAATLLTGLAALAVPAPPARTLPCPCGQQAHYQRMRTAQVTTLVGPIAIPRAYYLCPTCHQGQTPTDATLQIMAGGRSAGLDELLAFLGATQDSFQDAANLLERLSLVHVCANTVRDATERLGAVLVAAQAHSAARQQRVDDLPVTTLTPAPRIPRVYISMDGIQTHLRGRGWSEMKVGCIYHTRHVAARRRPDQVQIRMDQPSYCATLADATAFAQVLWSDALRRGVLHTDEIVVLGDGSHWIWTIAERQFAGAVQILDWYHASSYVWMAATAIWPTESPERATWAKTQLDRLWEGQVEAVIADLAARGPNETLATVITYYTNQRSRMDYPRYRACGMQIGSGSIESACKQLVTTRLKLAGMIWDADGAEAVVAVRAMLKSGRWAEAMALRPVRMRTRAAARTADGCLPPPPPHGDSPAATTSASPSAAPPPRQHPQSLPPAVRAQVQRELAEERTRAKWCHPWKQPWSIRQQRAQAEARQQSQPPPTA
jgi:hypothetical protein